MHGFLFRLMPPRTTFSIDMSDEERAVMVEHVAYWSDLAAEGCVVAFGPVADDMGPYGIGVVLAADLAAALAIRDRDPALQSPHGFTTEVHPMPVLVTPSATFGGPAT